MFKEHILKRLAEFETLGREGEVVFDFSPFLDLRIRATIKTELAFCISTANSSATAGLKFQKLLESLDVREALVKAGVRFHNRKEEYIKDAFEKFDAVMHALELESKSARKKLLEIKGLGLKEASHFLRNVGRIDVAIIDRHVLRWLIEKEHIPEIPNMTERRYAEIERILYDLAEESGISLAELDLKIWAEMTGKVLK